MGNVDEILDSMGPRELAAMEAELDKKASEQTVAYYFNLGKNAAREALAEAEKTGHLTPELFLVKQSKGFKKLPPHVQAKVKANQADPPGKAGPTDTHGSAKHSEEIDAVLDKCSEEQLTQVEAALDEELAKKATEEKAARYLEIGRNLAKQAVRVRAPKAPKPKAPKPKAKAAPAAAPPAPPAPPAPAAQPGLVQKLTDIVKQHPGASMAGAAGVGYLAGRD